ncbi:hypothetical protein J6590_003003 [Homalodisca vitripennis]|nr:hypothetical protein J6590_003003 [Homalodisca vitripennis]
MKSGQCGTQSATRFNMTEEVRELRRAVLCVCSPCSVHGVGVCVRHSMAPALRHSPTRGVALSLLFCFLSITLRVTSADFPLVGDLSQAHLRSCHRPRRCDVSPSSSPTSYGSLQTNMTPDSRSQICDSVRFQTLHVRGRGRDIHEYEARGRDNYCSGMHITMVYEHLPSQTGVHFINRLPNEIKNASTLKVLKTRIKLCLASNAFYSVDEFLAFNWETTR